jgi:hypothetical protein
MNIGKNGVSHGFSSFSFSCYVKGINYKDKRMSLFQQTEQDIKTFHKLAGDFWKTVPDEAWEKRNGQREKDWTLHQCLAHLLSIAIVFNKATDAAMRGEELDIREFSQREQLGEWNDKEIARLSQIPPNGLIVQLLHEWQAAGEKAHSLSEGIAGQKSFLPVYNRPARAIDFIDWQLSHAGIIHGAQVTRPLGLPPLWTRFDSDFTQRMIWRFMRQWSVAYWPDLGADEPKILNFVIEGAAGGGWHLVAAKDGGRAGEGILENADYSLTFETANIFFSMFTLEIAMLDAFTSGKVRLAGDIGGALGLLRLFAPTKPRSSS